MPYVGMIHLKDFYIRKKDRLAGLHGPFDCRAEGWLESLGGTMLRGAILGQGDIDIVSIVRNIRASGYDGFVSLEFEGSRTAAGDLHRSPDREKNLFADI